MQTFGTVLVALLAASEGLVSAAPSPTAAPVLKRGVQVRVQPRTTVRYMHPALAVARAVRKFNAAMPTHINAIVQKHQAMAAEAAAVARRAPAAAAPAAGAGAAAPAAGGKGGKGGKGGGGAGGGGGSGGGASGSAATAPEKFDTAYITKIQVGTPPQTLPVDFDTGSSDFWVFSSETPAASAKGHVLYEIGKSSTAKRVAGATWQITYGDGSASSGNVYTDVVSIGNVSVRAQAVESATSVSAEFAADTQSSGLVGLAMGSLNTVKPAAQKTFFDNAKAQLGAALFTADLRHSVAGSYTFGALDPAAFTGTMHYAPLYNATKALAGFWTFQSSGFAIGDGTKTATAAPGAASAAPGGKKKGSKAGKAGKAGKGGQGADQNNQTKNGGGGFFRRVRSVFSGTAQLDEAVQKRAVTMTPTTITGIADTGTTLLMLPDAVVKAYYAQVPGAKESTREGGWVFGCAEKLPDFSFAVGDGAFTVPGSYINWQPIDATNTTCFGGMQSDAAIGLSIFGDIALKAGLVVFDAAAGRIGWAQKKLTT